MSKQIRYTSGFANFLAILTIIIEVISGVILFILYILEQGIIVISPDPWDTLVKILIALLAVAFIFAAFLLYSPLYEFLPYITKVFVSILLTIFALLCPVTIGWKYFMNGTETYLQFAFLAIVIFIVEAFVFYAVYAIRGKKLIHITNHRRALESIANSLRKIAGIIKDKKEMDPLIDASNRAFRSWEIIVRHELVERWDLSRIIFQSLFIAMAFYSASLVIILKVIDYATYALVSVAMLFVFMIILAGIDAIRSEKLRAVIR